MSWLVEMPSLGRWLLTVGISAIFLVCASTFRRPTGTSVSGPLHQMLNAVEHIFAYSVLTALWMWTLEPVQLLGVRIFMSLTLALGLGSLVYLKPATTHHRATFVNSAGILLGVVTVFALVAY